MAYQLYEWEEAIEAYSESLFLEPKNYVVYSKRAAAYLKSRQPARALDDANKSLAIKPSYHKSYRWKAEAFLALQQHDKAVAAFKEGLKIAPGDEALQRGLERARRLRDPSPEGSSSHHTIANASITTASTATSTVASFTSTSGGSPLPLNHLLTSPKRNSKSNSHRIAMSPQKQSTTAAVVSPPAVAAPMSPPKSASASVSSFVRQTRESLNQQLELVQAKLGLMDRLASMDRAKKLDMLFALIDNDNSGAVDAEELAVVLRTRNSGLSVGDSVQRAMSMVAAFDVDGNAQLDRDEFETFLGTMLTHLAIDFDEFTEYLSLHLSFPPEEAEQGRSNGHRSNPSRQTNRRRRAANNINTPGASISNARTSTGVATRPSSHPRGPGMPSTVPNLQAS